jgi:uncharacterized protein YndB with AHSA1/START domain
MKTLTIAFFLAFFVFFQGVYAQKSETVYDIFSFEKEVVLIGPPESVYDAITGDISGWWDHSFSDKPYKLYIEAKPGGGFFEIFNENGDGVKHATVIYAERGKLLRMDGPLGLSGKAIQMVTTYAFSPAGNDSTKLILSVHGAGEVEEGIPAIVEKVWDHFLIERFKPYYEAGFSRKP